MVADEDYVSLAEEQLFGPGRFQDTLRIVVFRKNLSKSLRNPESKTLMLTLVAGGDFQLGIEDGREMKLSVNDILFPQPGGRPMRGNSDFIILKNGVS